MSNVRAVNPARCGGGEKRLKFSYANAQTDSTVLLTITTCAAAFVREPQRDPRTGEIYDQRTGDILVQGRPTSPPRMLVSLLVTGATIVTMDAKHEVIENGASRS